MGNKKNRLKTETAKRLKRLRTFFGHTQETVARETGLGQSTLAQIESGSKTPGLETIQVLLDFYEFTPKEFYSFEAKIEK